jgi:hypothetical protein
VEEVYGPDRHSIIGLNLSSFAFTAPDSRLSQWNQQYDARMAGLLTLRSSIDDGIGGRLKAGSCQNKNQLAWQLCHMLECSSIASTVLPPSIC